MTVELLYVTSWRSTKSRITRWFTSLTEDSTESLHVFCYASKDANGTVAYITMQSTNHVSFVMAISRVVLRSTTLWSIPRKEMIAFVEDARIAVIMLKAMFLYLCELHM